MSPSPTVMNLPELSRPTNIPASLWAALSIEQREALSKLAPEPVVFGASPSSPLAALASTAYVLYNDWDKDPLTRDRFADLLFELAQEKHDNYRAAILDRYTQSIARRLGAGELHVLLSDTTFYHPEDKVLSLDYAISRLGVTANQQINAWTGLVVRGVFEHLANQPETGVARFMAEVKTATESYEYPWLGKLIFDLASGAVLDRAIAAEVLNEYPGFSRLGIDGLYALSAISTQAFMVNALKQLATGSLDAQACKRLLLEVAGRYLQAEATAPGYTFLDPGILPWATRIVACGELLREVSDLETDQAKASEVITRFAEVVREILELDEPEDGDGEGDPNSEGLPDLSGLQAGGLAQLANQLLASETATGTSAAQVAVQPGDTLKARGNFDQAEFQRLSDTQSELAVIRTPLCPNGGDKVVFIRAVAKAGANAFKRFGLIKSLYGAEIRQLRKIVLDAYQLRVTSERGLTTGLPDGNRLASLKFGRRDVFKLNRIQTDGEPIDVVVLIDESGSMQSRVHEHDRRRVPLCLPSGPATREQRQQLSGHAADLNPEAEFEQDGTTRADVARIFGSMIGAALKDLPGIRVWGYGYTTDELNHHGLDAKTAAKAGSTYGDHSASQFVRQVATPGHPEGFALTVAYADNSDKQALSQAYEILSHVSDGSSRQAIIYLADGGVSDNELPKMIKRAEAKGIAVFMVDMSGDEGHGDYSALAGIKHRVCVDSIPTAVRAIGKFFTQVVLAP